MGGRTGVFSINLSTSAFKAKSFVRLLTTGSGNLNNLAAFYIKNFGIKTIRVVQAFLLSDL